jgi:hypothetical protein
LQKNPRKKLLVRLGVTNNHSIIILFETAITLFSVMFAWIFFRADNVDHAIQYISIIFSPSLFTIPQFPNIMRCFILIIVVICFFLIEWFGREQQYAISKLGMKWKKPLRCTVYYAIIFLILWFSGSEGHQFIYFQF